MIAEVHFTQARFAAGSDPKDARNVVRQMKLHLVVDRRGISDLIKALASCIDGASGALVPSHHGDIYVEMLPEVES